MPSLLDDAPEAEANPLDDPKMRESIVRAFAEGCEADEVAAAVGIPIDDFIHRVNHDRSLVRDISAVRAQKRAKLRKKLFEVAETDPRVLMFVARTVLGMDESRPLQVNPFAQATSEATSLADIMALAADSSEDDDE